MKIETDRQPTDGVVVVSVTIVVTIEAFLDLSLCSRELPEGFGWRRAIWVSVSCCHALSDRLTDKPQAKTMGTGSSSLGLWLGSLTVGKLGPVRKIEINTARKLTYLFSRYEHIVL